MCYMRSTRRRFSGDPARCSKVSAAGWVAVIYKDLGGRFYFLANVILIAWVGDILKPCSL